MDQSSGRGRVRTGAEMIDSVAPSPSGSSEQSRMDTRSAQYESPLREPPLVLSVAEAAASVCVSDDLVYELLRRGMLPCLQTGSRKVVPRRAMEMLVEHTLLGSSQTALQRCSLPSRGPTTDVRARRRRSRPRL